MKRRAELRDLSDDHHTGLVLAVRCKRAGRDAGGESAAALWAQLAAAFDGHLEPHFRIEEEHLLPVLEELGEGELAARIRSDHAALRSLRDQPAPDLAAIARVGELLEAHIRFEEREVFERVQDRLPREALAAIVEACRTTPRLRSVSLELG